MKLLLKQVHRYFYIFIVVFFFMLLYPLLYFYSRKEERFPILNRLKCVFSFLNTAFAGIFFKYTYETKIDWSKTYIICPNHSSNLDIQAVSMFLKTDFAFMGKEELLTNPILGLFFRSIDIPVNRDSKISAFRAFKKAGDYLQKGRSVILFPEGTISEAYPPLLQSFKNGAFRLAIEHKIPIIPVSLVDVWGIMWDDGSKLGTKPGIAQVYIHSPIETKDLTLEDTDNLRDRVYNIINSKLKHAT